MIKLRIAKAVFGFLKINGMITLRTTRHFVEAAKLHFFPFINLYKQSRLNNVAHHTLASDEYLSVMVINCLLTEVETLLVKKLVTTKSIKLKFEFSDAHGAVLYQALMLLKLPSDHYINTVRIQWIEALDQELIRNNLYQLNTPVKGRATVGTWSNYAEL